MQTKLFRWSLSKKFKKVALQMLFISSFQRFLVVFNMISAIHSKPLKNFAMISANLFDFNVKFL